MARNLSNSKSQNAQLGYVSFRVNFTKFHISKTSKFADRIQKHIKLEENRKIKMDIKKKKFYPIGILIPIGIKVLVVYAYMDLRNFLVFYPLLHKVCQSEHLN